MVRFWGVGVCLTIFLFLYNIAKVGSGAVSSILSLETAYPVPV